MMGEPVGRQDRLFYEFDLEDMVPGDHLLRRITFKAPTVLPSWAIQIRLLRIPGEAVSSAGPSAFSNREGNMRKSFWSSLLVVALMSLPAAAEDVRAVIEKGGEAWMAAFNAGDAAGVAALYSETAMLLPPDATQIQGRQAVQDTFQAWIDDGLKDIVFETVEVEASGDLAYEVGLYSVKVPAENDQMTTATGNFLVVWKKEADGVWRLYRDTWNDTPPPSE